MRLNHNKIHGDCLRFYSADIWLALVQTVNTTGIVAALFLAREKCTSHSAVRLLRVNTSWVWDVRGSSRHINFPRWNGIKGLRIQDRESRWRDTNPYFVVEEMKAQQQIGAVGRLDSGLPACWPLIKGQCKAWFFSKWSQCWTLDRLLISPVNLMSGFHYTNVSSAYLVRPSRLFIIIYEDVWDMLSELQWGDYGDRRGHARFGKAAVETPNVTLGSLNCGFDPHV